MMEQWSDEELDLGLRKLFSEARRPFPPSALRMYPGEVVASPRGRRFGRFVLRPTARRFLALGATVAIALAIAMAAMYVKPGGGMGSKTSPSATPSAAERSRPPQSAGPSASIGSPPPTSDQLPAVVQSGSFLWHKLPLPTEANTASWIFSNANGITVGGDCHRSGPAETWTSGDELSWRQQGSLPGAASTDGTCPTEVIWDGSRYVASGAMTHASQPGIWLPAVWTSADGTTWGLVKVATILPQQPMGPIAFGNGAYVVVIDDSLWQSTDLAHWSKVQQLASGTADGRQPVVRFANGWFAASVAGSKGDSFVYYSVNGRTWHVANVSGAVQTLVARPSGFVAVLLARDYSMPVVGSADGRLWKPLGALPIVNGQCNLDMLLCTDAMGITHGFIYSADGVDWQNGPWPAALTSNLAWGPSPDPMFVTVFSGPDLSTTTVYVIQPQVQP